MKHNFLKKLTALLLGTIMVFSMIPAIAIDTHAADETIVSLAITGATGTMASDQKSISWSCEEFTWTTYKNTSSTAIRTSDSAHFRVYVGNTSTITATSGLISKILITAITSYVPQTKDCTVDGAETSINGTTVTISFDTPVTSFNLPVTSKTWRLSKVEVYFVAEDGCDHNYAEDSREDATCTEDGSVHYVCSECGDEKTEILEAGHKRENGVCTVCGEPTPTYTKVGSDLTDFTGTYLIVYEAGKLALNGANIVDAGGNGVTVELENGVITGEYSAHTFTITKDGANYIIQSASGKYIGKTSPTNGLNISQSTKYTHTISIDNSGNAVIKSSGGYVLMFNAASDEMRFRYYNSTQKSIALYKLDEAVEPEPEETPSATVDSFGVTLNKGVTVRVTLTINEEWLAANSGAMVKFSNDVEFPVVCVKDTYEVTLTPGYINSDLTVIVGNVTKNVSFGAYRDRVEGKSASDLGITEAQYYKLIDLLDAIAAYGDAVANDTAVGEITFVDDATTPDIDGDLEVFGEIAGTLDKYANIIIDVIKLEDGMTYSIMFGGNKVAGGNFADIVVDNKLTIENLRPANFNDDIVITVTDVAGATATATFDFNGYLKGVYETKATYKNLAAAAYNYGVATEAYMNAPAQ